MKVMRIQEMITNYLKQLLIVKQILLVSLFGSVWRTVWRISILMLGCKGLTNRFHVAMHLFSNRSQMISKCSKDKKKGHEKQPSVSLII